MAIAKKLNGTLRSFIKRQRLFFVATAAQDGRVNLSPKGMDTLRIVDDHKLYWLSLSGSGNETAAHLLECPRMTLMFCAFEGDAMILRIYGNAIAIHPRDDKWQTLLPDFPKLSGSRQIFEMNIELVQTSCGTGVPVMNFVNSRAEKQLVPFYEAMGASGVKQFWRKKNRLSIDGKATGIFGDRDQETP